MILSSTVRVRNKLNGYGKLWEGGFLSAGWSYIWRRLRWSIVRMIREVATIPMRSLIFWDLRFGLG
jgi:hypothetical protein